MGRALSLLVLLVLLPPLAPAAPSRLHVAGIFATRRVPGVAPVRGGLVPSPASTTASTPTDDSALCAECVQRREALRFTLALAEKCLGEVGREGETVAPMRNITRLCNAISDTAAPANVTLSVSFLDLGAAEIAPATRSAIAFLDPILADATAQVVVVSDLDDTQLLGLVQSLLAPRRVPHIELSASGPDLTDTARFPTLLATQYPQSEEMAALYEALEQAEVFDVILVHASAVADARNKFASLAAERKQMDIAISISVGSPSPAARGALEEQLSSFLAGNSKASLFPILVLSDAPSAAFLLDTLAAMDLDTPLYIGNRAVHNANTVRMNPVRLFASTQSIVPRDVFEGDAAQPLADKLGGFLEEFAHDLRFILQNQWPKDPTTTQATFTSSAGLDSLEDEPERRRREITEDTTVTASSSLTFLPRFTFRYSADRSYNAYESLLQG
jgi:hypothetical protein